MASANDNPNPPEMQSAGLHAGSEFTTELSSHWVEKVRWMRILQVVLDGCLVALSLLMAYLIRFDGAPGREIWHQFLCMLSVFVGLRLLANWICGVYTRLWRYTGLAEVIEIGVAMLSGSTIVLVARAIGLLAIGKYQLSYGIILLEPVLSFVLVVSVRVIRRLPSLLQPRQHSSSRPVPR